MIEPATIAAIRITTLRNFAVVNIDGVLRDERTVGCIFSMLTTIFEELGLSSSSLDGALSLRPQDSNHCDNKYCVLCSSSARSTFTSDKLSGAFSSWSIMYTWARSTIFRR